MRGFRSAFGWVVCRVRGHRWQWWLSVPFYECVRSVTRKEAVLS